MTLSILPAHDVAAAMQHLRTEVARTSIRKTAARLGVCPATISLALRDQYPASHEQLALRVMRMVKERHCPYLHKPIPPEQCAATCTAPAPIHNPAKMAHWKVCAQCEHKRQEKTKC